jgi:FAD/FMN-containing dehydrogenase
LINRREFLAGSAAFCLGSQLSFPAVDDPLLVNDIHSQLNPTHVNRILKPENVSGLQAAVRTAKAAGKPLSIAGGRHAMGGQQFGTDMILVDMTRLNQIVSFDPQSGLVEVQAGAFWPDFIRPTFSASKVRRGSGVSPRSRPVPITLASVELWQRTLTDVVFRCSRS